MKIKLLIWKAIHGGLPVNERLAARNIIPTAECGVCGAVESIDHVFFSCPLAQEVWRMVPVKNDILPLESDRFVDNWIAVVGAVSLPPTGVNAGSITAWVIWRLWTTRNYRIFQEKIFTPQEVVTKAIVDAKEWAVAQEKKTDPEPSKKRAGETIRIGITCKTDAAWNQERMAAGAAWNFSQLNSGLNRSDSEIFTYVKSPLVAEGLALRAAMEQALVLDYNQISFESDSKMLVTAILEDSSYADLHGILSDIKTLKEAFTSVSFRWVNRDSVSSVDLLAKQTLNAFVLNL